MINEATVTKLYELRLNAMVDAFRNQTSDPAYNDLSFEERFALLIDSEWHRRKNNKLGRLIKRRIYTSTMHVLKMLNIMLIVSWIKA